MTDQQGQPRRRLFARTRARIEEFEKSNDDFRGLVEHFKANRDAYLAGAGCLVLGFVAGKHRQRPIAVDVKTVINHTHEAAPPVETIADVADDVKEQWNVIGLFTDEITKLLTHPDEHLHIDTNLGGICLQHVER